MRNLYCLVARLCLCLSARGMCRPWIFGLKLTSGANSSDGPHMKVDKKKTVFRQGFYRFWKSEKSGRIERHFSSQGKVREFGNF